MQAETIYQVLFWIGVIGVGAMALMGAGSHGSHGGSHGHIGHSGHGGESSGIGSGHHTPISHHHGPGDVGAGHTHTGHGGHGTHTHQAHNSDTRVGNGGAVLLALLGWLSPMTLFTVSLGAGSTGMLLGSRYSPVATALLAFTVGVLLFAMFVRPLMQFVLRFASKPAQALSGAIAAEAIAQNRFDAHGRGIVTVNIDGQLVRLLAFLETDDHTKGIIVSPGDQLVVTQIDEAKNTCRVTKI